MFIHEESVRCDLVPHSEVPPRQRFLAPRFVARRFFDWWTVDRIVALIFFVLSIVLTFILSDKPDFANFPIVALSLSNLLLTAAVVLLLWRGARTITAAEMSDIANQFSRLVSLQCEYEATVSACLKSIFAGQDSQKHFDEIDSQLNNFIKALCDTAAYAITKSKGDRQELVSANIKMIMTAPTTPEGVGESVERAYQVWKRSEYSKRERDDADEETKKNEFRVKANMMYATLIANHISHSGSYGIVDNLRRYLTTKDEINRIRIDKGAIPFKEPSEKDLRFFRSCLVVPIHGRKNELLSYPEVGQRNVTLPFGEGLLVGIFCVDSKKRRYFNHDYDVLIMRQLAEHAFSVIQAKYALITLRASRRASLARKRYLGASRRAPRTRRDSQGA
jgi:hypothetical protein